MSENEEEVKEVFEYEVNGTIYTQRKMRLGQVKQMNRLFNDLELPSTVTAISMFTTFGGKLPEVMAIVLCKKGAELKDKNLKELEIEFETHADMDIGFQVVQDFFDCNPIASYFTQMTGVFQKLMLANQAPE
jgi:uncharacterized protein YqgV (UPF0045/DUF77 family)